MLYISYVHIDVYKRQDEDIIQPAILAIISHLILVGVSCLVNRATKVKNKLPIEPVKKSHCKSAK